MDMVSQQPLDIHQQELVNAVKATHQTLAIARKLRSSELSQRLSEAKFRYEQEQARIKMEIDAEIATHAARQDEALIAAYNEAVPIRRIALEGFGNQYDGAVTQLLVKLRNDGRLGNREGFHRQTTPADEMEITVAFPHPVDVPSILTESTTIDEPYFMPMDEPLVLAEGNGKFDAVTAQAVTLVMDRRDPYFKSIAKQEIPTGSHFRDATTVTLYVNGIDELITHESKERSDLHWEHPVARWVKDHPEEARAGFDAAIALTPADAE